MLLKWLPWKYLVQRAARSYGFMDPITFLARMRRFSQPSEVQEPLDLLRAGVVFHARGLINSRVIQHNLDWVWPFWVERQFNPNDPSFIPRAFSFSHINLTHRNWTAVGLPDLQLFPLVDPRGLVTPVYDGWSLDFWIITASGRKLLPSKIPSAFQHLEMVPDLAVVTRLQQNGLGLYLRAFVDRQAQPPALVVQARAEADEAGWLAATLRPYNPEGIHFIETITYDKHRRLRVNGVDSVDLSRTPDRYVTSTYVEGDVLHKLPQDSSNSLTTSCKMGMATAAALFAMQARQPILIEVCVPLDMELHRKKITYTPSGKSWPDYVRQSAVLKIPDEKLQYLYNAAVRTLILLSAGEIVPGPYTYRRFWFRDAVQMIHAMLAINLTARSQDLLDKFFKRQDYTGYFQSQEGEWDSNGQVLWILDRYQRVADKQLGSEWLKGIYKGAEWIRRKRRTTGKGHPHSGLLPAGFSAEHLGPNDYYYWDDFWAIAGLYGAARLAGLHGSEEKKQFLLAEARDLSECVFNSIAAIDPNRSAGAIPASPHRRMDAGAIGSLVADYPLRLTAAGDPRIMATVTFLMDNCFHSGGFFQDMIHSGVNAYLTLTVAQVLLRSGDERFADLMKATADLASDTGQWPEAVHPITGGGCMGDGQHGWAAAEWLMMMHNLFVREEDNALIIGSGIRAQWLESGQDLVFGPTTTPFGRVKVYILREGPGHRVQLETAWHGQPPQIILEIPGFRRKAVSFLDGPIPLEAA